MIPHTVLSKLLTLSCFHMTCSTPKMGSHKGVVKLKQRLDQKKKTFLLCAALVVVCFDFVVEILADIVGHVHRENHAVFMQKRNNILY